jgi:tRNA-specific 2-thiouridylase
MSRETVTVAFSGGKDSTAAILLLREQGYAVQALTMRLGLPAEEGKLARIENLARVIGVPWQVSDLREAFREKVLDYFLEAYRIGLTPNPCVLCNRFIKFGLLMDKMEKSAPTTWFASGHYAAKVCLDGRWFLKEPVDRRKSQIYFLAMIEPAVLAKVIFPIAALTIDQVRAKVAGLPLANMEESQDVCFLQGAIHFTVGQRRGTGHASDRRLYVVGRDMAANTVMLGDESDLLAEAVTVKTPVFWRPLQIGEKLMVKIRYQLHGHEAEITEVAPTHIHAVFNKPVRAVTPGQFGVFYDGDIIVAAGEIVIREA